MNYTDMLTAVRAFYLDLAAWAALDPRAVGAVGSAVSDRPKRDEREEDRTPTQSTYGSAHTRATTSTARTGAYRRTTSP